MRIGYCVSRIAGKQKDKPCVKPRGIGAGVGLNETETPGGVEYNDIRVGSSVKLTLASSLGNDTILGINVSSLF